MFGVAVILEFEVTHEDHFAFDRVLQQLYYNGELQDCADAVFKLACMLPFSATRCLSDFIDAIIQLLR